MIDNKAREESPEYKEGLDQASTDATNASLDALVEQQQGLPELLRTLVQLFGGFSGLVVLETRLALSSAPRYLELAFLKLFMLVCVWLSLSGVVMWLVFLASGSVLTGLLAMTGLQVAGYLICKKMQDVHKHRLSLPHTREQLAQLAETINESIKAATNTDRPH